MTTSIPTVAVVTTVRQPNSSFLTWCQYHSQLFHRVFIFVDSPQPNDYKNILKVSNITIACGNKSQLMAGPHRVMIRQIENVKTAIAQCHKNNIDWLVHIDSDELWIGQPEYFTDIPPEVGWITFVNHEIVHLDYKPSNPFLDIHLFKVNGKVPFLYYVNGKSAARISSNPQPNGVHEFYANGCRAQATYTDAYVLHYPIPTYDSWVRKYSQLAEVEPKWSDFWFENERVPIGDTFHRQSRDVYARCAAINDFSEARAFYEQIRYSSQQVADNIHNGNVFLAKVPI